MKKCTDLFLIVAVSGIILMFGASFWLLPDKPVSELENRTLQTAPEFTSQKLLSGEYTDEIGRYFADQFLGRDAFVGIKAYAELAMLKGENNDVIKAEGGQLISLPEKADLEMLSKNIRSLAVFSEAVDIPVYIVPLPRTADVFSDKLPSFYPKENIHALYSEYKSMSEAAGLTTVDLFTPLCESGLYYRTDHHYTTDGAYLCYRHLAHQLGYTAREPEAFTKVTVCDSFRGTSMRSSGFYLTPKDSITLYRYESDDDYRVVIEEDNRIINGFYDFDALDTTDKYAVFLGGNHGRVDVLLPDSNGARPKLLMIRDSFADSIVPFLAYHYDITLIDLRYYRKSVQKLAAEVKFDAVLVFESLSEFDRSPGFGYLQYKGK